MNFSPVTPLRPAWQVALLAGVIAAVVGLGGSWIVGQHALESFGWQTWLLLGMSFALAFTGATWAAAQWMSPSGRCSIWRPLLGLILAGWGLALGSRADAFEPLLAAQCFSAGSGFAIATALILLFVFRRTAPIMRQRVATAAGVLSGLAGFLTIQLHCPINEFWHMLCGHALLPVIWGLIGYWATRLAFR